MALFLYTCVTYLVLPLVVAFHLLFIWRRPEFRGGFWQRYGWHQKQPSRPIIVHAASVGEVNAIASLVLGLVKETGQKVLVTTTSVTGQARAQELFRHNESVSCAYLPFDLGLANAIMLHRVKPLALLLVETELWPNLISSCALRNIPTFLVNGRLSERSEKSYGRFGFLIIPMLQKITGIFVQDEASCDRFVNLGADQNLVSVLGSLKYDIDVPKHHEDLGLFIPFGLTWVCGSTRIGEESALISAWMQLPKEIEGTLVLVPRHPNRFDEVADLCEQTGLPWQRYSAIDQTDALTNEHQLPRHSRNILLVDKMGLLLDFYRQADLVFVGGSLADIGGHNPLEPAALGKPVIMGPHCFNFTKVCDQLEQVKALKVTTNSELLADLTHLLADQDLRQSMGEAGALLVQKNKGALAKHLSHIKLALGMSHSKTASGEEH